MNFVFVLYAAFWVGLPVTVILYARRLLRAIERRSIGEAQLAELTERLQRLETLVESVADDTERLNEDQRFTRQLLTDRHAEARTR